MGRAHPTGRKLVHLCPNDIRAAAGSGVLGPKLAVVIWTWAVMLHSDVAELESLNNLLKLSTKRAPNISLELVDARAKLKKWLGVGAQKISKNSESSSGKSRVLYMSHDSLLDRAAAVVQECTSFGAEAEVTLMLIFL